MRPPHSPDRGGRAAGFTLLEVLIAFVIAALAIGVMVDAVVGGLRSAATAAQVQQAVALARSRMAAAEATVLSGPSPQPTLSGSDAAFRWRVDVHPSASAALPRNEAVPQGLSVRTPTATLYAIKVVVSWTVSGATRQVRLDGAQLRLSNPAAGS
jgi:general secretion pathway protein I